MLPETEQLLQKWLKIQLWQFRLMVFRWVFVVILFLIGIIGFFTFALPTLRSQLEKLDRIQGQLLNLSNQTEQQSLFLDQLKKGDGQQQELLDIFFK